MKKLFLLLLIAPVLGFGQTTIHNENFVHAVQTCLYTNPIDGLCNESEYGAMPDWDVTQVTVMSNIFNSLQDFNVDLSKWDMSNAIHIDGMFWNATSFNQDLSNWDVSNAIDMTMMFRGATSFNQDLSNWNTSNVTNLFAMFMDASSFNGDISNWDTSNVIKMRELFRGATSFNQDLSNWNTSNVVDMYQMFIQASSFNGDISNWDTSNVTNMYKMFYEASSFNQNIGNWDISNVPDLEGMFYEASSFDQDISNLNFNISSLNYFKDFLSYSGMSTENYNKLLVALSFLYPLPNGVKNVIFDAIGLKYCSSGSYVQDDILSDYHLYTLYNSFAVNDSGQADSEYCASLNVEKISESTLVIYPNPTTSIVTLQGGKQYDIEVYTLQGKKVMALTGNTIDMSHLSSATYIVKALDKVENEEVSYKVVKN